MITYRDIREIWLSANSALDVERVEELASVGMKLYEGCDEDLLKSESLLELMHILRAEKEVSLGLSEEIDELQEENAALRKVAEAAREAKPWWDEFTGARPECDALAEALYELDRLANRSPDSGGSP